MSGQTLPELHPDMPIWELIREAHRNAREKGFWEVSRNIGEKIALIHSELSEALEAYLDDKGDDAVLEELADVLIRTLDLCGRLRIDLEPELNRYKFEEWTRGEQFPALLGLIHRSFSMALEAHRAGSFAQTIGFCLAQGWAQIEAVTRELFEGDLRRIMIRKMTHNRTRPYLHNKQY